MWLPVARGHSQLAARQGCAATEHAQQCWWRGCSRQGWLRIFRQRAVRALMRYWPAGRQPATAPPLPHLHLRFRAPRGGHAALAVQEPIAIALPAPAQQPGMHHFRQAVLASASSGACSSGGLMIRALSTEYVQYMPLTHALHAILSPTQTEQACPAGEAPLLWAFIPRCIAPLPSPAPLSPRLTCRLLPPHPPGDTASWARRMGRGGCPSDDGAAVLQ